MTKILKIYSENPQERLVEEVVEILRKGGLIVYPSDTVYALGCDINNTKAMEKLAQLKGTKLEKSRFSIICNDLSHLSEFTKPIETSTFRLLKSKLPGAFTFILNANRNVPLTYKGRKTIGIRVPDHSIPQMIVEKLGNPIASTSIRDEKNEMMEYISNPELIAENFEKKVDIVIDSGWGDVTASTVIDLTQSIPKIIRQGKGRL